MEKIKPMPIYPIWIFLLIIVLISILPSSNPRQSGRFIGWVLLGCMVISTKIHLNNKKYFGKDYKKNPKLTEEGRKKFENTIFNLSNTQKIIVNVLIFVGVFIGMFTSGILGLFLWSVGFGFIPFAIFLLLNKDKRKGKVILFLALGIIALILGVLLSYNTLIGVMDDLIDKYELECEEHCLTISEADSYLMEFNQATKEFDCYCFDSKEEIIDQISFKVK